MDDWDDKIMMTSHGTAMYLRILWLGGLLHQLKCLERLHVLV